MFLGAAAQAELYAAVRARWGIELRDPTADRRLVELAVTQPEWWRRHKGEWRAIPRAAMRDVLPTEIVDRQTLGAQQPDWLDRLTVARHEILAELEEMRDHHASYDLIDVERLDALVADWPDRSRMTDPRVVREYQLALARAVSLSRYLRWFEGRAKRVRAGGPAVVSIPRR
jgi:asparagine synthase (glutamine-hydrolysing)